MTSMKYDGFGEARIEVSFDVDRPVELVQLTLALQAMARDYRRYANDIIRDGGGKVSDDDIKLYVTKVASGSIIAELGSAAQVLGTFFAFGRSRSTFLRLRSVFWRGIYLK